MKRIINKVKNDFMKNVSIVMFGTIFAQIITVLIAPLLTRLYTPEDFGVLTFYISAISILGVVASFRYEITIVMPKKEKNSAALLILSSIIVVLISILTFLFLFLFKSEISTIFGMDEFSDFYYLIPFGVLFLGLHNAMKNWNIRKEKYMRTSISNIINSGSYNITQLLLGIINPRYLGLIIGRLFGQFLAFLVMAIQIIKEDLSVLKKSCNSRVIKLNMIRYSQFPLYGMPQALFNSMSQNIVPILLLLFFNSSLVGFYSLALRMLQMPVNLIGNAFKSVFLQKSSSILNENGDLKAFYYKSIKYLVYIILPFFILIFIFGPLIFTVLFGEEWAVSGEVARWLMLWIFTVLISRPTIVLLQVLKKQKAYLFIEIIGFFIKVSLLIITALISKSFILTIAVYSFSNVIFYLVLMLYINKVLNNIE